MRKAIWVFGVFSLAGPMVMCFLIKDVQPKSDALYDSLVEMSSRGITAAQNSGELDKQTGSELSLAERVLRSRHSAAYKYRRFALITTGLWLVSSFVLIALLEHLQRQNSHHSQLVENVAGDESCAD